MMVPSFERQDRSPEKRNPAGTTEGPAGHRRLGSKILLDER